MKLCHVLFFHYSHTGAARPFCAGTAPEAIATEAAASLALTILSGACVDEYMQDQLIIFMALARGTSRILSGTPTLHTSTAINVAEKLTGCKFRLSPVPSSCSEQGDLCLIECTGAGFSREC